MGASYGLLFAQCSLRYVPYARISNEWVLLTDWCLRGALHAMCLMLVFQMSGCFSRTGVCAVLLTLCVLCSYFKGVGASYELLFAQCSLRYVANACITNEWVVRTDWCSLRYVPYVRT